MNSRQGVLCREGGQEKSVFGEKLPLLERSVDMSGQARARRGRKPNKFLPFQSGPCVYIRVMRSEGARAQGWEKEGAAVPQLGGSRTPNTLAFTPAQAGKKPSARVQATAGTEK